jgi:hypothetical protein
MQNRSGPQPLFEDGLEPARQAATRATRPPVKPVETGASSSTPIRSAARSMLICPLQASSAVTARTFGP